MIIGITGGVGAGKSQVLSILKEEYQAAVLIADEIGHLLMEPGQVCYRQIIAEFSEGILREDNTIDRSQLSALVFGDEERLEKLNRIIHPAVKEYIKTQIADIYAKEPEKLIVIEAALLLEDHYEEICDEIWYIYADEATRRKRLKESRGYSDEKIDSIMKNQLSEAEFRKNCQKTINNSGSLTKTREELKKALEF